MAEWLSGRVARKTKWNDSHFSIAFEAAGPRFEAGQFVRIGMDIDGERVARPYSLINPPHAPLLEIFFNVVPDGPLSSALAAAQPGDPIWVGDRAGGLLVLDEVPGHVEDFWLLASGTGVGPFLSMLQTDEPWQRFEHVTLAYGARFAANLGYRELIARLQAEHAERFRFVPLITGEALAGAVQARIPVALADGRLEQAAGTPLRPAHSHVMLCGHAGMISDAVEILEQRGLKRHRRNDPGQISTEKYH